MLFRSWLDGRWAGLKAAKDHEEPRKGDTGVPVAKLKEIGLKLTKIPKTFKVHRTMQRVLDARRKMIEDGAGIDWAMGEHLAFGSLLLDGFPIRLSGQDVVRGAFSQRHFSLADFKTGAPRAEGETPPVYLAQLALYRAALAAAWPGRRVRRSRSASSPPSTS